MQLTASVECGKYIKADRGTLTFTDGQLRFETGGRSLFDVPLSSMEKIVWHWYSFSAAFEATVSGQKYFLSFVPRGAGLNTWYAGLSTGRKWRAAFEGRPAPESAHIAARLFLFFFRIIQIFLLGCCSLLSLSAAIDPAASIFVRILAGVGAAALALLTLMLAVQGIRAIFRAIRGKK